MEEEDLLFILEESRLYNQANNVTGMLLYIQGRFLEQTEGRFTQILEGSETEVLKIFNKIKEDDRHKCILILNQGVISKRNFTTWSMGFKALEYEGFKSLPGYFELNDDFLRDNGYKDTNQPLDYLKSFYQMNKESDLVNSLS